MFTLGGIFGIMFSVYSLSYVCEEPEEAAEISWLATGSLKKQ